LQGPQNGRVLWSVPAKARERSEHPRQRNLDGRVASGVHPIVASLPAVLSCVPWKKSPPDGAPRWGAAASPDECGVRTARRVEQLGGGAVLVGSKDIRAFDGVLTFTDLLDNAILSSKIAINEPLKAGSVLSWRGGIKYNQFMDEHQRLRNEQQKNLKIRFMTRKILFADGTSKEY
jgi:hypothetical protein